MIPDQKFQQLWEYRKKDDDIDSSSDDSKSLNSGDEPVQKKHKVLDLVLAQNDEESDVPLQITGAKNRQSGSRKKRIAAVNRSKGNSGTKRKRKVKHTEEPVQLTDDLKTFTNSLLKELKVARDTMFIRMKRQITKLTASKSSSGTKRKAAKSYKAIHKNENGGLMIEKPKKNNKTSLGSRKRLKATDKRRNGIKKETTETEQTVSCSNLALPGIILPKPPQVENLRTNFSSSDHIHAGNAMKMTNILERENVPSNNGHYSHGYLPSIFPDEQFGNISQMRPISMNPGLHVPSNQWPNNNCFSITNQIVLENPPSGQENNMNSVVLRNMINGGIRFPGRSHATDAGPLSFRSHDVLKESRFPPK